MIFLVIQNNLVRQLLEIGLDWHMCYTKGEKKATDPEEGEER